METLVEEEEQDSFIYNYDPNVKKSEGKEISSKTNTKTLDWEN